MQLNIFLAILIDGYAKVKEASAESPSLVEELHGVISHEVRRLLQLVCLGPSHFVSDDQLATELAATLVHAPTTMNRALGDYASVALANFMEVPAFNPLRNRGRPEGLSQHRP